MGDLVKKKEKKKEKVSFDRFSFGVCSVRMCDFGCSKRKFAAIFNFSASHCTTKHV